MAFAKLTISTTLAVAGIDEVVRTITLTDEAAIRTHGEIGKLLTGSETPKRTRKPKDGEPEPETETPSTP